MGFDYNGVRFARYCKGHGVDFSKTATIGKQQMYQERIGTTEDFLADLGAKEVDSWDVSDYEGATKCHDFNKPVSRIFHCHYTAVFDLGSLEHIFNFPVAIANCMKMTTVGGHFLSVAPANNWFAHGFYQLQPDLFYRTLHPENGFKVKFMFVCGKDDNDWIKVPDSPRFQFDNAQPTYIMVAAKRIEDKPIFESVVMDSFYAK